MSSVGQVVGSVVGFTMGAFFGVPWLGMAVGGLVGYWLDPSSPEDNRPDVEDSDLSYNTFTRNTPVAVMYGSNKMAGQIIWIGESWYEQVRTGGGGSGKDATPAEYTTYYYATFAIALGEGTINSVTEWYINDDDISTASEEDDIDLDITEYTGTAGQDVSAHSDMSDHPNYKYLAWAYISGKLGTHNVLPTISCECKALLVETGDTYAYDANPIKVLYDYLTNDRYGLGYDSSLVDGDCSAVGTSFKEASDYCDALVSYSVDYIDENGDEQTDSGSEPRFRFSRIFSQKQRGWDVISEILKTCRGMLFYKNGKLAVKIENSSETPVFYFCDEQKEEISVSISGGDTLTATLSSYSNGFWDGAEVVYTSGGNTYTAILYDQISTGGTVFSSNPDQSLPDFSGTATFYKDVIKNGSFSFQRRSKRDVSNKIRLEFINRRDNYRTDHAEIDCVWDMDESNEIRETTVVMKGIKRESQANRMVAFLADFGFFVQNTCTFETDILGQFITVGDIIGVTHAVPNWSSKLFRIVAVEELSDFNSKLTCLEYVPSVYHDNSQPCYRPRDTKLPNKYASPSHVERFQVFLDSALNTIWITFKPHDDDTYFSGIQLWVQKGGGEPYELSSVYGLSSPSVELDGAINDTVTEIVYDPATMYNSFSSTGVLWIDNEKITYTGIDDVNNKFTGCTRGVGDTVAASHLDGAYAVYQTFYTPKIIYTSDETGITWSFKAVAITLTGMRADAATAPTDSVLPPA